MPKLLNNITKRLSFFLFLAFLLSACSNRPKEVVSEKRMVKVLCDLHTLEGSLIEKGSMYNNDSAKASYYAYILHKNGITKVEFDSSLVFYTKNPKKFELIYQEVITKLSAQEKEVKSGKFHPAEFAEMSKIKINIWSKKSKYEFTKDSTRTRLNFEIKDQGFLYGDVFVLKFLQRIAPCDSSKKPFVLLRINYHNGEKDYACASSNNDSLMRRFTLKLPAQKMLKIKSITGCLLGSKSYKGKFKASLDSISLTRIFKPSMQDSIRKMVQKADTTNYTKIRLPKQIKKLHPIMQKSK